MQAQSAVIFMFLFVISLILLYFASRTKKVSSSESNLPYYLKNVLTTSEQVLFHILVNTLPEFIILSQVQVSRVLGVNKGNNFHEWNNRINRLSYDFVICRKDFSVIAVIELDDKSHDSLSRQKVDKKKEEATLSAGINFIRWRVNSIPDSENIQSIFKHFVVT